MKKSCGAAMLLVLSLVLPCAAQITGDDRQRMQDYLNRIAPNPADDRALNAAREDIQAKSEAIGKAMQTGQKLFGDYERYKTKDNPPVFRGEYYGSLASKHAPDFQIGDWGYTNHIFKVISKVSDTECLVLPQHKGSQVMLIRGLDMSKVTDGVQFILPSPVVIESTYSYTAVTGERKTVLVLECNDRKLWLLTLDELIAQDVRGYR